MARWFRWNLSVGRLFRLSVPHECHHASVSTPRLSNRTCGFAASGSRRRLTQSPRPLRVTPSATPENSVGVIRLIANLPFRRRFLRPPSTEAPSLDRNYPVSLVVRASPSPQTAQPASHEVPVDCSCNHRLGFPVLRLFSFMPTCRHHYPGRTDGPVRSYHPSTSTFPI